MHCIFLNLLSYCYFHYCILLLSSLIYCSLLLSSLINILYLILLVNCILLLIYCILLFSLVNNCILSIQHVYFCRESFIFLPQLSHKFINRFIFTDIILIFHKYCHCFLYFHLLHYYLCMGMALCLCIWTLILTLVIFRSLTSPRTYVSSSLFLLIFTNSLYFWNTVSIISYSLIQAQFLSQVTKLYAIT